MEQKSTLENMELIKFNNVFKNKKVLITGNTGFKGSWLTIWLSQLGADVYGLSKDIPTKPSLYKEAGIESKITHFEKNILDKDEFEKIVTEIKPNFIFHLAAQAIVSEAYKNPVDTIATNVIGTVNLLDILRKSDFDCSVVLITSDKCYHNVEWAWGYKETDRLGGKDVYSSSKAAAEILINSYFESFFKSQNNKIKIATARAGNVIGGGDWAANRIVPDCVKAWAQNKTVEIRSPMATRPWQHVLEPLSGYLLLAEKLYNNNQLAGESINFGPLSSISVTVENLIKDLSKNWNFTEENKAYKITDNIKFNEAGLLKLNCDKALMYLKWLPTLNYEQTVQFTGGWYSHFYKNIDNIYDFTISQILKYEQTAFEKKQKWIKQL